MAFTRSLRGRGCRRWSAPSTSTRSKLSARLNRRTGDICRTNPKLAPEKENVSLFEINKNVVCEELPVDI